LLPVAGAKHSAGHRNDCLLRVRGRDSGWPLGVVKTLACGARVNLHRRSRSGRPRKIARRCMCVSGSRWSSLVERPETDWRTSLCPMGVRRCLIRRRRRHNKLYRLHAFPLGPMKGQCHLPHPQRDNVDWLHARARWLCGLG